MHLQIIRVVKQKKGVDEMSTPNEFSVLLIYERTFIFSITK